MGGGLGVSPALPPSLNLCTSAAVQGGFWERGTGLGELRGRGVFPEKQQGGTCAVCLLFGSWLAQPERLLPAYSTRPLSPPNGDRHPLAHSHLHNHSLQPVGPPTPKQTHGAYGSGELLSHEDSPVGPQHRHRRLEQFAQPDPQQSESKLGHTQSHPGDILRHRNDTLRGTLGQDLQDHMPSHIYTAPSCVHHHTCRHPHTHIHIYPPPTNLNSLQVTHTLT